MDNEHASFRESRQKTIAALEYLADELDKTMDKVQISKVASASGGVASAALAVGGAITSFIPPLSLFLWTCAGVVGVSSGVTGAGATIGEILNDNKTRKAVNIVVKDDNAALIAYQKALRRRNVTVHVAELIPIPIAEQTGRFVGLLVSTAEAIPVAIPRVVSVITLLRLPNSVMKLISEYANMVKKTPRRLPTEIRTLAQKLKEDIQ